MVRMARNEEMQEGRKHALYEKVPVAMCWDKTGKAPSGVRWVDINKGDKIHPEYRARLVAKEGSYATIRLPSGETRLIHQDCWVTIGRVGNSDHANQCFGKAGRKRWMGRRPHVRGSVMNPVDHPHGGGEGRAPIGRPSPVTPWGKRTLGKRTRKSKKYSDS